MLMAIFSEDVSRFYLAHEFVYAKKVLDCWYNFGDKCQGKKCHTMCGINFYQLPLILTALLHIAS